ncbi:hypothetical protein [Bacillus albus]|uniref:hypothetical protein n=1 Tax=Bacillus albus TaxID=2026189 RepID=UPI0030146350
MDLENIVLIIIAICGIIVSICMTVSFCLYVYICTWEMIDDYKRVKKVKENI